MTSVFKWSSLISEGTEREKRGRSHIRTLLLFVKWMMGKASLWFHLFRPITHTLHTVSFACHLMTDQPACIISAAAQWKEDLRIMRSWRKWSAVLPKRNGAQKSSTAAGVPMTMWEAVSFQFSRKLRAKKTVICERRSSWQAIILARHPQDEHSAVFVVT